MRKTTRRAAAIAIAALGYMAATDAVGRWTGLWGLQPVFNLVFVCSILPLLYLAIDKRKITSE